MLTKDISRLSGISKDKRSLLEVHVDEVPRYRYHLKIHLAGEGGVGKTSIVQRLGTGVFQDKYKVTLGSPWVDILVTMPNDENARLQVWDVAGATQLKGIQRRTYQGTAGLILVYDISRNESIESAWNWVEEVFEAATEAIPVALVGNKADLRNKNPTQVDRSRRQAYARAISEDKGIPTLFLETSALTGHNVARLFSEFSEMAGLHQELTNLKSEFQDLENMVNSSGWKDTKEILAKFDKRVLLDFFSYPGLHGLLISKKEILDALPDHGDYYAGGNLLRDCIMKKLEKQVEDKGETFDLDIEKMTATEASMFVGDIINLRRGEIGNLIAELDKNKAVGRWDLWNTYYGRKIIESMDCSRECSLSDTKRILSEFVSAGIDFEEM